MPTKNKSRKRINSCSKKKNKIVRINKYIVSPVYVLEENENIYMKAYENIKSGHFVAKIGCKIIAYTTNKMSHMAIDTLPSIWKETVGDLDPDSFQQKKMIKLVEKHGIGLNGPNNMKILMCNSNPEVPHDECIGHFVHDSAPLSILEKLGKDNVSSIDITNYWKNSKPNCIIIRDIKEVISVNKVYGIEPINYDYEVEHCNSALWSIKNINKDESLTISKGPHIFLNKNLNANKAEKKLIDIIKYTSELNLRRQANHFLEHLIKALKNGIPFGNLIGCDYWSIFILVSQHVSISIRSLIELKWAILTSNGSIVYWNHNDRDVIGKIEYSENNIPRNPNDLIKFIPNNCPIPMYLKLNELEYHENGLYNSLINWKGIPSSHSLYKKDIFKIDSNKEIYDYTGIVPVLLLSDGVRSIRTKTFMNCMTLTKIVIPNSITKISKKTFYGCKNLEEIVLPESIEIIEDEAFMGCTKLTTINFSPNLTRIGKRAFKNCNLIDIELYGIVVIDDEAFENNKLLEKIWMNESIKIINENIFKDCINLQTFLIDPSNDNILIKNSAFTNCNNISTFDVPETVIYL